MINDREIIKGYTNGLEPGKLYINDLNHPICYLAESEKGVLFDTNTCNVHMFRFISVRKNGNTYYLNFMRFFVANQKINCIILEKSFDQCFLRR